MRSDAFLLKTNGKTLLNQQNGLDSPFCAFYGSGTFLLSNKGLTIANACNAYNTPSIYYNITGIGVGYNNLTEVLTKGSSTQRLLCNLYVYYSAQGFRVLSPPFFAMLSLYQYTSLYTYPGYKKKAPYGKTIPYSAY